MKTQITVKQTGVIYSVFRHDTIQGQIKTFKLRDFYQKARADRYANILKSRVIERDKQNNKQKEVL